MIEWIFKNLGVVIFAVIVISQLVRGAARARKATQEPAAAPEDYDEQRRTREVQERVRRQIAERRGMPAAPPPMPRAETTQLPELFGGPLGRMLEELQKRAEPAPVQPPPLVSARTDNAELERQAKLAAEIRALEDAKRRTAVRAVENTLVAQTEPVLRADARGQLLGDLAQAHSLRRAIVLREVLGPPVALR
jgi:cell division septation protein DedD